MPGKGRSMQNNRCSAWIKALLHIEGHPNKGCMMLSGRWKKRSL